MSIRLRYWKFSRFLKDVTSWYHLVNCVVSLQVLTGVTMKEALYVVSTGLSEK